MIDTRLDLSQPPDADYLDLVAEFCTEGVAGQLIDRILDRSALERATLGGLLVQLLDRTISAALEVMPQGSES